MDVSLFQKGTPLPVLIQSSGPRGSLPNPLFRGKGILLKKSFGHYTVIVVALGRMYPAEASLAYTGSRRPPKFKSTNMLDGDDADLVKLLMPSTGSGTQSIASN